MTKDIYRMSCILRETVPKNVHLLSATSLSCNSKAFSNCNVRWHCFKMQSRGTTKTFPNYLSQSFRKMFLLWSKFHSPRQQDVIEILTTSLCTYHWRRRYVSNEALNHVLPKRLSGTSVQHLIGMSWRRLKRTSHEYVSDKSQMKHPTTSQWWVTKRYQWYISTTSY